MEHSWWKTRGGKPAEGSAYVAMSKGFLNLKSVHRLAEPFGTFRRLRPEPPPGNPGNHGERGNPAWRETWLYFPTRSCAKSSTKAGLPVSWGAPGFPGVGSRRSWPMWADLKVRNLCALLRMRYLFFSTRSVPWVFQPKFHTFFHRFFLAEFPTKFWALIDRIQPQVFLSGIQPNFRIQQKFFHD